MSTIYTDGELRFFRLAKGLVDHSTEALRKVFIQEWNRVYPSSPWQNNNSTSGSQLLAKEEAESRLIDPAYNKEYKHIKDNLSGGNAKEWDVTTLVFALKYSYALKPSRFGRRWKIIMDAIHQLKEVRNSLVAHACKLGISESKFKRNIDILLQSVEVLVTKSDPLFKKLQTLKNETEFLTGDNVRYKQWLKDDHNNLLLLEKDLEILEEKMKISTRETCKTVSNALAVDEAGNCQSAGNNEIIASLRNRVERVVMCIDLAPSNSKPNIFESQRYIKMMDRAYFLKFNLRWKDLLKFLRQFTSTSSDLDIKLFAAIPQAAAMVALRDDTGAAAKEGYHSHCLRSKNKEELQALNDLIPNALKAKNGVLISARIKVRKALILHDLGDDDEAMREIDDAKMMLSLSECQDDAAEVHNAIANIILSSGHNRKTDQEQILFHLDRCIKCCEKATVDKSATIAQVTLRKALVHLGFYQHGILEDVTRTDVDIAETVLKGIAQKKLTEKSIIYFMYAQSLLAFRKGDTDTATKLEQKARKKCERHNLYNQLQQLNLLRSLIRQQPKATAFHRLLSILFLVLLIVSIALEMLQ